MGAITIEMREWGPNYLSFKARDFHVEYLRQIFLSGDRDCRFSQNDEVMTVEHGLPNFSELHRPSMFFYRMSDAISRLVSHERKHEQKIFPYREVPVDFDSLHCSNHECPQAASCNTYSKKGLMRFEYMSNYAGQFLCDNFTPKINIRGLQDQTGGVFRDYYVLVAATNYLGAFPTLRAAMDVANIALFPDVGSYSPLILYSTNKVPQGCQLFNSCADWHGRSIYMLELS